MSPETGEHLAKAREYLTKARGLLDVMHYNDEAGRAAYLAGFHAAQAFISERTGKIAKTHEGVHSQFIGRKPKLTQHQQREAIQRCEKGDETLAEIGRSYNVSGWTIARLAP